MARLKLGILFGGSGEEHLVSVKSAREVAKSLDTAKYEPFWIGITRDGAWKLCDGPDGDWESGDCRPVAVSPDRSTRGLLVLDEGKYDSIGLDVVLPVLHGKFGEDGAMQGLLELSGIPYVGCDIPSSAVCMDKSLTYTVVSNAGIATPKFWIVNSDADVDPDQLNYPVFVKPARSGSAFGISKVSSKEELSAALTAAREYDAKVLIEEAVVGSEVGSSILGNGSELLIGELDRVVLTHGFFKIHQEASPETGSENSSFICPADISDELRDLVKETAKAIYRALGCRGLARVDLFVKEDGSVVLNEVNTLPGLTSYSRYPRMMKAAGFSLTEVIDRLVSLALADK
ncbi:D-alanine--(R)-lactate ligase [Amycolatopsis regifaucium]|uniref:D-alanine--D-alanine ligase n=1 Tax=Amycolatopsis regifaucium TaxID=546365 RepID=A0A154M4T5_9PSEU|nr:D-alanine--(R)-lactate ligase [Amycolatopsis regifaucium]KZB79641.1 D-alanine--D-alanine ligase [Amycolatopsis regifaucium]OKA10042.1 D-alanine--(R)-lactate ligase [Amycolatopsis regifaucium]SFI63781.1 D-alanine---(R)-lactate ligase [Amycolatopsis regifaucium]